MEMTLRASCLRRLMMISAAGAVAVVVLCSGSGMAQQEGVAAAPPPSVRASSDGLYDIDASGADVKYVLECLARRAGANIVVSPEVSGELSIHVAGQSIESILDYIALVQDCAWKNQGGVYILAPKQQFEEPPPVTPEPAAQDPEILVWQCKHVKPADLIPLVEKLFPEIKVAEGPDSVTPVIADGGGSMGGGDSYGGGGASGVTASAFATGGKASRIVLLGQKEDLVQAEKLLKQLDVSRPQISIDVLITEIKTESGSSTGIQWSWNDLVLQETAPDSGIRFGKFAKLGMTFTAAISALVEDGTANLLAQPNISVLDGESASILIGDRILYPKLEKKDIYGNATYEITELPVGISLQIAPRVSENEDIVLTLYPQVSVITKYLTFLGGEYPQISTREARTTVRVRNGSTLAIGGLMRDEDIKNLSKVPLLGDLPILGGLFRHMKTTKNRTEIVIFLTPKIVEDGNVNTTTTASATVKPELSIPEVDE